MTPAAPGPAAYRRATTRSARGAAPRRSASCGCGARARSQAMAGTQVRLFEIQATQPGALRLAAEVRLCLLREFEIVAGVSLTQCRGPAACWRASPARNRESSRTSSAGVRRPPRCAAGSCPRAIRRASMSASMPHPPSGTDSASSSEAPPANDAQRRQGHCCSSRTGGRSSRRWCRMVRWRSGRSRAPLLSRSRRRSSRSSMAALRRESGHARQPVPGQGRPSRRYSRLSAMAPVLLSGQGKIRLHPPGRGPGRAVRLATAAPLPDQEMLHADRLYSPPGPAAPAAATASHARHGC